MSSFTECDVANARMAAIASALQGKYGLIRTHESLALIHILSADCLLNPGAKRLTAFDIHLSAVVYAPTARPGQFSVSAQYRTFIAYDLVALFSSPSTLPAGASSSPSSVIAPPPHWLNALKTLERRASEPGRGGFEGLYSVFADDNAVNTLIRASVDMSSAHPATYNGYSARKSSFALLNAHRVSAC